MADQAVVMRAGQAGAKIEGTPGHVLTIQEDGKVKPQALPASGGGALRAKWAFTDSLTFSDSFPGSVSAESGVFFGVEAEDLLFVPPMYALLGAFHSGSAAPQLGGLYRVITVTDTEHINVERASTMATAAQIAAVAIVTADQGNGAGVYQICTPADAVIDVDPQVMPHVALPPLNSSDPYFLVSTSGEIHWQIGSINSP